MLNGMPCSTTQSIIEASKPLDVAEGAEHNGRHGWLDWQSHSVQGACADGQPHSDYLTHAWSHPDIQSLLTFDWGNHCWHHILAACVKQPVSH